MFDKLYNGRSGWMETAGGRLISRRLSERKRGHGWGNCSYFYPQMKEGDFFFLLQFTVRFLPPSKWDEQSHGELLPKLCWTSFYPCGVEFHLKNEANLLPWLRLAPHCVWNAVSARFVVPANEANCGSTREKLHDGWRKIEADGSEQSAN